MRLLSLLNKIIPKKKRRIVLYANLGFRDNVKALYDYLIKNEYQQVYDIVCVSNNFYSLEKRPEIKYVNPYVGVYYFLTSQYFFYCFGKYPINPAGQQVVNLWHGMPLKKIGNLLEGYEHKNYNYFTHLVASSPMFWEVMKKSFNAVDSQALMVGNIRNDELFMYEKENIIMWMPTYRNDGKKIEGKQKSLPFVLTEEDFNKIESILSEMNLFLAIKLHPLERQSLQIPKSCGRIFIITDEWLSNNKISLYEYLGKTTALITDYSSVFLDYLLLDRVIAFTIDDRESYAQNRGFVFENMDEFMVGPQLNTVEDVCLFLENIEVDEFRENRQQLNEKVNSIKNNFCYTLLKELDMLL